MKFKGNGIKTNDFDFSFGWNYNSLNRGYFPTKGVKASLGGRVTIPGSDNKYYKLSADVQGFYPLDRDHLWVVSAKASAGYANGFRKQAFTVLSNLYSGWHRLITWFCLW